MADNYQNGRSCEDRYEMIKKHLPASKGFSVMDIGSNMGKFSQKTATDFKDSIVFSMEADPQNTKYHAEQLEKNKIENNFVFNRKVDKEVAHNLYHSPEVVDIMYLLAVIHWFEYPYEEWRVIMANLISTSRYIFVEPPSIQEKHLPFVGRIYSKYGGGDVYLNMFKDIMSVYNNVYEVIKIGESIKAGYTRPMYLIKNKINIDKIDRKYGEHSKAWVSHGRLTCEDDVPVLSFKVASIQKDKQIRYEHPGFTLWTVLKLNFMYPKRKTIAEKYMESGDYDDMNNINIIITSGGRIANIDTEKCVNKYDKNITYREIIRGVGSP